MNLITEHLDIWTAAQTPKANGGRGRGRNTNGQTLYGIKKLRELILELAVRGKLVPQDSNDEPASVLLEKIAKEKARLIKEGKIKKQKPLPEIGEDEKPFELPVGWSLARLGNITCRIGSGSTPRGGKSAYIESGIPFLRSQNVWNHGLEFGAVAFIPEETHEKMSNTIVLPNDILLNITGASLGRCAIYPSGLGEANVSQHVTIIRLIEAKIRFYLHFCILSPYTQSLIWGRQVGMAREGLSKKVLELFEIPIPPLAEQNRIVTKVDELMDLCDQLEQQQTDSNATHQTLVETLLATLTNAADQKEFSELWQRIADHFDTLFTTEQSIDRLKQTILQLAVMGKLVPQDPNDEPASVLLEKIAKEKARLIKVGKIKKQKPLAEITDEEKRFELPEEWTWARLQDAIDVRDGTHDTPKEAIGPGTYPLVTSKNFCNGAINFDEARRISAEDHFSIAKRSFVERYDILFSMIGGNLGNQVMVCDDRPFSVKNVALFKYYDKELTSPFFIKIFLEHLALDLQSRAAGGAQPFVSLGFLRNLAIAIPPFKEQHRIVAKVDELMALCDNLKARLNDVQTTEVQLADVLVAQAAE